MYRSSFMHDKIENHKKPGRHQLKLNFHLNKEFGHIKWKWENKQHLAVYVSNRYPLVNENFMGGQYCVQSYEGFISWKGHYTGPIKCLK